MNRAKSGCSAARGGWPAFAAERLSILLPEQPWDRLAWLAISPVICGLLAMAVCRGSRKDAWSRSIFRVNPQTSTSRAFARGAMRSEEHTSELQSQFHLVCRLLLEKKKKIKPNH